MAPPLLQRPREAHLPSPHGGVVQTRSQTTPTPSGPPCTYPVCVKICVCIQPPNSYFRKPLRGRVAAEPTAPPGGGGCGRRQAAPRSERSPPESHPRHPPACLRAPRAPWGCARGAFATRPGSRRARSSICTRLCTSGLNCRTCERQCAWAGHAEHGLHVSALCGPQSTCPAVGNRPHPCCRAVETSRSSPVQVRPLTAPRWAVVRPGRRQTTCNFPVQGSGGGVGGGGDGRRSHGRVPPPLAGSTAPTLAPAGGKR